MRLARSLPAIIALNAALTACSAGHPVVRSTGNLPTEGSVGFVASERETDREWQEAISKRLAQRGLAANEPAQYAVQWAVSQRPLGVGALAPDPAKSPEWLLSPGAPRSKREDRLTVELIEVASGKTVYSGSAATRVSRSATDTRPELLDALFPPTG